MCCTRWILINVFIIISTCVNLFLMNGSVTNVFPCGRDLPGRSECIRDDRALPWSNFIVHTDVFQGSVDWDSV